MRVGDERHSICCAPAARGATCSATAFYNIFRKFQRDSVWEAIWAELHMALHERMGRRASPSAAVLDSQSVKSVEKGAAKTTEWVTTPART
jgi:transposase